MDDVSEQDHAPVGKSGVQQSASQSACVRSSLDSHSNQSHTIQSLAITTVTDYETPLIISGEVLYSLGLSRA